MKMRSLFLVCSLCVVAVPALTLNFRGQSLVVESPPCYLPLDVVILQDTTQTFKEDLVQMREQIPDMVSAINETHPGSWFGVAEFKDKPYDPFGWPDTDFCYRLASPLSDDVNSLSQAYATLYASGGEDYPESQYQGIINTFKYNQVGWRPMGNAPGQAGARLIIMSTDAAPHYAEETNQAPLPAWCVPNDGEVTQDDIDWDCNNKTYPSYNHVAAAVAAVPNQYVAMLTPSDDPSVVSVWQWVNEGLLHQPPEFYQLISNDSSDFILGVLKAIEAVGQMACPSFNNNNDTTSAPPAESTTVPLTTAVTIAASTAQSQSQSSTSTSMPTRSSTETTSATAKTTKTETADSGVAVPSTPTSGPMPDPCTRGCKSGCGKCNNEVAVKISGKPKHMELDIEYTI